MSRQKKKKSGVPQRWLEYGPAGRRLPGTRFIAFKVPLKPSLNRRVSESDSFGLWDLLDSVEDQNQDLGLIVDLTFTSRYYSLSDVPQSCSYIKIPTAGRHVPSDAVILAFKRAVRSFLNQNRDNDQLIGVHCTHGLNRTGYLVCRYLIDVDGLEPEAALQLFNSCRGHPMERQNYLQDLHGATRRSNAGMDHPQRQPDRGLATQRPARTGTDGLEGEPKAGRGDGPPRGGPQGGRGHSGGPQDGRGHRGGLQGGWGHRGGLQGGRGHRGGPQGGWGHRGGLQGGWGHSGGLEGGWGHSGGLEGGWGHSKGLKGGRGHRGGPQGGRGHRGGPQGGRGHRGGPQGGRGHRGGPQGGRKLQPEAANHHRPPQAAVIPTYQWKPPQQTEAPPPV